LETGNLLEDVNMSLHATVQLDRTAVILAGRTDFGRQTVPITDADLATFSETERKLIAERVRGNDGEVSLTNLYVVEKSAISGLHEVPYPTLIHADLDAVRAVLAATQAAIEARDKKEAEQKAARLRRWDEAQREWLARSDEELLSAPTRSGDRWGVRTPGSDTSIWDVADYKPDYRSAFNGMMPSNEVSQRMKALDHKARLRTEEHRRVQAEEVAAGEALLAAAKRDRDEILRRAVMERGTDGQRKRLHRGLLPEDEMLALYRDQVFAPLEPFARYERITKAEIADVSIDPPNDDDDYEFHTSDDIDSATDMEVDTLEAIEKIVKARLPAGTTCQLREHLGGYESADHWTIRRKAVLVTVEAPIKVSREYACP
jgi:hypothetical protein